MVGCSEAPTHPTLAEKTHIRNADLIKYETKPDRFSKPVRFDNSSFGFIKS